MAIQIRKALRRFKGPVVNTGPGKTEQAHKNQCDVNYILKDYVRTGLIKHSKKFEGKYDDISVQDFQDAMFKVANAQSMFEALPGAIRMRFKGDPVHFLEFVQNPANEAEMRRMGILRGKDGLDVNGAVIKTATEVNDQPPAGDNTADTPPAEPAP